MEQPKVFKQLAMDTLCANLLDLNTEDEIATTSWGN